MKDQKGINKIAVIIGVVIGLLIVAIGGVIILSNGKNKQPQTPAQQVQEPENTEVSADEQTDIETYLEKFTYVAIMGETGATSHERMSQETAMVYMATENVKEESNNANSTNQNTNTTLNNGIATNTVGNEATNTLANTATNGDNRLSMDIGTTDNTNSANTAGNTLNSNIPTVPANQNTNVFGLAEDTIQNAVFEMFGQKLDNLSTILQTESIKQETSDVHITQIQSLTKSNGIYTAVYNACIETNAQKQAGVNIYGLDSYAVQAKFEKNDNPEYSEYKLSSINITTKTTPTAYYETYVDGKCGVIDNNGMVILDAKYSAIEIPNSYIGLFICSTEGSTAPTILNEKGIEQFTEYDSVNLITATSGTESSWTEDNILLTEKDGYFGAIDFKGNVIYDVIYEEIKPLGYEPERLVLTKSGNKILADTKGNIISNGTYSKIGILGIDFESSALVTATRTQEDVINLMQQDDYVLGLTTAGTYEILETKNVNEATTIMNKNANSYGLTIGTNWQLVALDLSVPVQNVITLENGQTITLVNQKPVYTKQLASQTATE